MDKQKIKNLIFGAAVALIFIGVIFTAIYFINRPKSVGLNPQNSINNSSRADSALVQTIGNPNEGIEITAVYEKENSQKQTIFKLSFNTHTVDFSGFDFKENVVLLDKYGKEIKASNLSREGAGHHQSIEIAFPLVASPFKLAVKNLAGIPERVFNF